MKTVENNLDKAARWSSYVLGGVLALMPFHAFLTVFLADKIGHYDLLRLWKEMLLLLLAVPATVIICKSPELWQRLRNGWLFWCLMAYVVLHLGVGLVALAKGQVNYYSLLYGWVINLRLVLVLMVALALASLAPWLRAHWPRLLLWPAGVVVAFGLLQLTVLPADFLSHFGYGPETIAPYSTVDQKQDYVRVQSSLRGANPLGAYLVLILGSLSALLMVDKRPKRQLAGSALVSAGVIVLAATYSRSAFVGAVVVGLVLGGWELRKQQSRRVVLTGLAILTLAVGIVSVVIQSDNQLGDRVENIVLHTDEHSNATRSSNDDHLSAVQHGLGDVLHEPFGRGPGTAGPASAHNVRPARIAENYYIQIAQEVGWLGLVLFVAINGLIAQQLWLRREQLLARVLLASLAGISVIGLLQHVWTDDTLSLIWWGMAGIALSTVATPAILNASSTKPKNDQQHGPTTLNRKPKEHKTPQPPKSKKSRR